LFAGIFRFYKGGCKRKAVIAGTDGHPDVGMKLESLGVPDVGNIGWFNDSRIEDGVNVINTQITRVIECTEPFVCTLDFLPTSPDTAWNSDSFNLGVEEIRWTSEFFNVNDPLTDPIIQQQYISNAPDFRYMMSMPPPAPIYWPSGITETKNRLVSPHKDDSISFTEV